MSKEEATNCILCIRFIGLFLVDIYSNKWSDDRGLNKREALNIFLKDVRPALGKFGLLHQGEVWRRKMGADPQGGGNFLKRF